MPLKPCPKNFSRIYLHFKGREDHCRDINGRPYYRYFLYDCDCGCEHKLDRERNCWVY